MNPEKPAVSVISSFNDIKSKSPKICVSIEKFPFKRKKQITKKHSSKLKENEKPFERRIDHSSPPENKKITDFFTKQPLKIKMSISHTRANKSTSSYRNIDINANSSSNLNTSSSFCLKRETAAENLKLKEEIRKLNKIMVDQDSMIESQSSRMQALKNSNKIHLESLEKAKDIEKVIKLDIKRKLIVLFRI